jgi:hypothetical protein
VRARVVGRQEGRNVCISGERPGDINFEPNSSKKCHVLPEYPRYLWYGSPLVIHQPPVSILINQKNSLHCPVGLSENVKGGKGRSKAAQQLEAGCRLRFKGGGGCDLPGPGIVLIGIGIKT